MEMGKSKLRGEGMDKRKLLVKEYNLKLGD
jgi:hypothetical protein